MIYNTSIRRCKRLVGLVSILVLIFWFCLQPTFMLYSVSKFAVNSDALRLQETGNEVLLDRHLQCCSISSVVLFTAFGIELIAVFGNKVIVVLHLQCSAELLRIIRSVSASAHRCYGPLPAIFFSTCTKRGSTTFLSNFCRVFCGVYLKESGYLIKVCACFGIIQLRIACIWCVFKVMFVLRMCAVAGCDSCM